MGGKRIWAFRGPPLKIYHKMVHHGITKSAAFLSALLIIPLRWNVKRDARASIGAYGGGNVAYYRVFTEQMRT